MLLRQLRYLFERASQTRRISTITNLKKESRIAVEWSGLSWPARVRDLDTHRGRVLVEYDGWSEKWNEWLSTTTDNIQLLPVDASKEKINDGDDCSKRLVLDVIVEGKSYKSANLADGKTVFLDEESGLLLWSPRFTHPLESSSPTKCDTQVELPDGWIMRQDSSGLPYYFNTLNWKAQWTEPRLSATEIATNMQRVIESIPTGWDVYFDRDGYPYYYNTNTFETVWEIQSVDTVTSHVPTGTPEVTPAVPDGWEMYFTEDGVPYFYCTATKTSYWELPEGVGSLSMDISPTTSSPFEEEQIQKKGKRVGNRKK
jgi:hypothetical protein